MVDGLFEVAEEVYWLIARARDEVIRSKDRRAVIPDR